MGDKIFESIKKIVEDSHRRYCESISLYRIRRYEKEFSQPNYPHESNIITYLNIAFYLEHNSPVFSEVQFRKKDKSQKRIDAYMFCDQYSLYVEAKSISTSKYFVDLGKDRGRMECRHNKEYISRFHTDKIQREKYGLIIGETWETVASEWWKNESLDELKPKWEALRRSNIQSNWICNSVGEISKEKPVWLYGIKKIT